MKRGDLEKERERERERERDWEIYERKIDMNILS